MPVRDSKETYNEYFREYLKTRWFNRRLSAIEKLGGKCVHCGSTDNLEFDHIDPSTKVRAIAKMSTASEKLFNEELSKCQLLCYDCHLIKTNMRR